MNRVAVDAMSGDLGPEVAVAGALEAARRGWAEVVMVGRPEVLDPLLDGEASNLPLSVEPAAEIIGMDEHPVSAVRAKREASVVVACRLVKEGRADAAVSPGNTGATLAAALLVLGRLPGVERPALPALLPTGERPSLILDVGANVDVRPPHLLDFARMGSLYMERVVGVENPRVGLLNIGEEETKGNRLVQEAFPLLREAPGLTFVGGVEPGALLRGEADVAVADGFVGNVAIKLLEGLAEVLFGRLKQALRQGLRAQVGAALVAPRLRAVARQLDYAEYGGVPLLGARAPVLVAHGRSNARAIASAVRAAASVAGSGLWHALAERFEEREG
ncbi:phosphate acyltransferase PlsX [Limnochorda pilosa]|uniref:Phosphate acyltransferase n=1 Tax=Limnochorda pilosa TaxID=1555112 RepID=A0A0K2SK34_LIMPI|nr:phosphate acyltransferase PlsX [Limnochorda pilosa]BAS27460.1 phosphate acyltransferase [Limnochorda pilosa]